MAETAFVVFLFAWAVFCLFRVGRVLPFGVPALFVSAARRFLPFRAGRPGAKLKFFYPAKKLWESPAQKKTSPFPYQYIL